MYKKIKEVLVVPSTALAINKYDIYHAQFSVLAGSIAGDYINEIVEIIPLEKSHWFSTPNGAKIYESCVAIHLAGQKPDEIVMSQFWASKKWEWTPEVLAFCIELFDYTTIKDMVVTHAQFVRSTGIAVDLMTFCGRFQETCVNYQPHEDVQDIGVMAIDEITAIVGAKPESGPIQLGVLVDQIVADIREGKKPEGLTTGFRFFDSKLGRMRPGNYIIDAARTSIGKTALGLQLAHHVSHHLGKDVMYFSMEMTARDLACRLMAQVLGQDLKAIQDGRVLIDDKAVKSEISWGRLHIVECGGLTSRQLRMMVDRQMLSGPVDFIVIDYIQQMNEPEVAKQGRVAEIERASREIKKLAMDLHIPIVALAQINREGDKRQPQLSDLKGSGALEQDADVVIILWRESDDDPKATSAEIAVTIAKNRNGPLGFERFRFEKKSTAFFEQGDYDNDARDNNVADYCRE